MHICGRGISEGNKRAQSTLEFTMSLMVVVILLAGMVLVLCWAVNSLVQRHNAYVKDFPHTFDNTTDNFYTPPKVSLVPQISNAEPLPQNTPITAGLLDQLKGVGLLVGNRDGSFYRNLLEDKNITVKYAALPSTVLGQYDPGSNTIFLDENLRTSAPESVILSLILHEATHADYYYDPNYWINYTEQDYLREHPDTPVPPIHIPGNSIDQEYNAFKNEVDAYQALRDKGGGMDPYLESLSSVMAQGEADAKAEIAKWYGVDDGSGSGGLPPY